MPTPRPTTRKPPRLRKQKPQLPTKAPVATINRPKPPKGPAKGVKRPPAVPTKNPVVPPVSPAQPTPPGPTPPPESSQGYATRTGAQSAYSQSLSGYKGQLVQAALSLGAPEVLQALRNNPDYAEYAGVIDQGMNDPYSTMSQLKTQETRGLQEVDEGANEGNTFFSGLRLTDRGRVSDDFGQRRVQAVNEFLMGPQAEATRGIGGALADYNAAMNEALGYDIQAALAGEPEARSNTAPKPAKVKNTAKAEFLHSQAKNKARSRAAEAEAKAKRLRKRR